MSTKYTPGQVITLHGRDMKVPRTDPDGHALGDEWVEGACILKRILRTDGETLYNSTDVVGYRKQPIT